MTIQATRKGPTSYFRSIEQTDGRPVAHGFALLAQAAGLRHGEQVALLEHAHGQHAHGLGHGHANALVAHPRAACGDRA